MKHQAKKSFGQNFLKSPSVIKKIIDAGEVKKGDLVLEIGPGKGALTEKLLLAGAKVTAVEKDSDLLPILKERFAKEIANKELILINEDILDIKPKEKKLFSGKYKIIANIPYNITGAIFKKFLSEENQPERMILMVQKEVADRILAKNSKESLLSISVKAYGSPKLITKVPKHLFSPEPKVDSAVIAINNISRTFFDSSKIQEKDFWGLVRAGFAHKRKLLSGNLKILDKKIDWKEKIQTITQKTNSRAEDLSLKDWSNLAK